MSQQKILVFVGAHPDDETFGVGATLAQYSAAGVKVYYICATRGEAGEVPPEVMKGYSSVAELRTIELEKAAGILGVERVVYLGYRDSGMPGSPDNKHPKALAATPIEEVAGRIVRQLRLLKPQVVITFDPIGGYRHPDHIAAHDAAVMAFHASGDPQKYPEAGPAFQPQKLYFHVFPHRFIKIFVRVMRLMGRDPSKMGRNQDIDFAALVATEFPVHAQIKLKKKSIETRDKAAACHESQMVGASLRRGLFGFLNSLFRQRDSFMRAEPPPEGRRKERDLFEGVEEKS